MDTHETISVYDQRAAHLSTDTKAELQIIIKDSSGDNPTVRQPSKGLTTAASDALPSPPTCTPQSSLVLSSTMTETSMNSKVLSYDYASISPFEKNKDIGQFNEG
uniref:Uncharacterized protein n=1 Tax=Trichobilharzia regenti TaxID=157069 RepID=A0AA85JYT6_TRIRE|nr:unnamed protein product [Trichobilharzia regenti]